jgi:hypothetical protein
MASSSLPTFSKLNASNYPTWCGEMQAWLRSQGVWHIVSGQSKAPMVSSPPKDGEDAALDTWYLKLDKAAGYIYLAVDENQKIHFAMISEDPVKMWAALAAVHLQKRPGACFNTYDDLFLIRKQEDETLQSLMNRVDTAINCIQDLWPKDFTLSNLDDELASMTLIRALPDEFSAFASSLLLLDKLKKSTIHQAFVTEESQRHHCASAAPNVSSALAALSSSSAASSTPECSFCGMKWHIRHEMAHRSGMSQIPQIKTGRTRGSPLQPLQTQGAESKTSGAANDARVCWKCKCTVNF